MLKFGFKRLIEEKNKDLFTFPYLTVGVKPIELKERTTFSFNESCRDLLKFDIRENKLSWLYDEAGDKCFYLINIMDVEAEPAISVTLDLSFSNKNLYERMVKVMELDITKEHYFQLVKVNDIEDLPAVKLVEIPLTELIIADHDVASASEVVENIELETILN